MARLHDVKLEIVRPGPQHNQLLSPLTSYVALCGEGSTVTFRINYEHHKLVSRLQQLRYIMPSGNTVTPIPPRMREAAVVELAEDVGRVLSEVCTLLASVWRAYCDGGVGDEASSNPSPEQQYVHLRLVLGGSELSLIPFEMAMAPPAMPGEGLEFCLQLGMPVVPTREIRSSKLSPVSWNQPEPRILVVAAAPGGLHVPLPEHLHAIRAAFEPWIKWPSRKDRESAPDAEQARLQYVRDRIRVLPDASIEDIYDICSKESFTHVHVLAHGASYTHAGEERFGVALCDNADKSTWKIVSGKALGKALQAEGTDGARRSHPLVVTLATCDSGNVSTVLVPGGSIAHELHAAGIPWVFASQFPLTKVGSVRMAETLYPRLLRGDDPRQVIYEVRRRLYMSAQQDHDWASLVVYASMSKGLTGQVTDFFERQTKKAIEVSLARVDSELSADAELDEDSDDDAIVGDIKDVLQHVEGDLDTLLKVWEARLPRGDTVADRGRRTVCYGTQGSTYKRIALLWSQVARRAPAEGSDALGKAKAAYLLSLERYRRGLDEKAFEGLSYHWTATQALCIGAVLDRAKDPETYRDAYETARQSLKHPDRSEQAWAHGTMAELELLGLYHAEQPPTEEETIKRVVDHCRAMVAFQGWDSFHVQSTRRQFRRYLGAWRRPSWANVAQAAVNALTPPHATTTMV